jgi:hypothetical protein
VRERVGHIGQVLRTTQRLRYLGLAMLAGALIASLLAVPTAGAAEIVVSNCAQLQHELNSAEKGDVITLAALCTESNSGTAKGSFNLNSTDLTIQGQSGTTAGFEGVGVTRRALEGGGDGLVLRNLVVENYSLKNETAVKLTPGEGALPVIEDDRFIDDTDSTSSNNSPRGGALSIFANNSTCAYTAPLSITGSLFRGDRIADTSTEERNRDQGGAAYVEIHCNSAAAPFEFATLGGNTFAEDAIDTQAGGQAFGGGLELVNTSPAEVQVSAAQAGNVFEHDSITSSSPTGAYGGGGEWAPSLELTSTGDRYTGNALPAPQGENASSAGAGLGMATSNCSGAAATLDDAVFAANTIGPASEEGESLGAGIYAACESNEPETHFQLTLEDSTVAGNQAPEGVSGIDGEDADQLTLANSIVSSPTGQADIGGFRPGAKEGGSRTSSFSDACVPGVGTSTPLPGAGNICVNPQLEANGEETQSSPTIDVGSNALVPAGLTTDAFGDPRFLAGRAGCGQSFPAVVDMGADELVPGVPSCPFTGGKPPPSPPRPGRTQFVSLKTSSTGAALRLSCTSTDGLGCSGTIYIVAEETLHGKRVIAVGSARHRVSATIGQAPFSLPAGGAATFTVKLNAAGRALLRRFHAISAYVSANEASPTSTPFIFLLHEARFSEPKQHGRGQSKHPKHH